MDLNERRKDLTLKSGKLKRISNEFKSNRGHYRAFRRAFD